MAKYYPRLIEKTIERKLRTSGAVLVNGPKFSGKTTTCSLLSKSKIALIDDDLINMVAADSKIALEGEAPRLIDEWQTIPNLWNLVRKEVDDRSSFGQFILTGSATPSDSEKRHHSGAGRIAEIKMRPMSLFESLDSKGSVSLKSLFDDDGYSFFDANDGCSLSDIAFYLCRGGWPMALAPNREDALEITRNYYEGLFNFRASNNPTLHRKRPEVLRAILRSYARNVSSEASQSSMIEDLKRKGISIDEKTFHSYLNIASDFFIVEDMEAWTPELRSKTAIRTAPTRHFVDPSIACCSLYASPKDLLNDPSSFGLLFEDLAVRDLRVYAESLGGKLMHYRDKNGLEIDSIAHLSDGRWGAIEIKLGSPEGVQEGVKHLLQLDELLAPTFKKPSFKMVLTAVGKAYRLENGVYVCPINLLRD